MRRSLAFSADILSVSEASVKYLTVSETEVSHVIAAPMLQRNHKFIDRSVSQWLNVHFGDTSFNGRIFIGHRRSGGGVYTMTARSLTDLHQYVMLIHASQRLDYYITANSVSGTSRTIDGLFGLQNIVIDVDCHDEQVDAASLVQAFLWRANRDLWSDGSLPSPNSIVRTGRGVQLWWAIKPCHASCIFYYNQIKNGIMDHLEALIYEYEELQDLQLDRGASANAVGYFRLPCTYNTSANRYGSLQVLHTARYATQELEGYLTPARDENRPERHQRPQKTAPLQTSDVIVLHNLYTTGANRVMQLIKLRNLRNNEVGSEMRNNLCFSVYNALRMANDHDESMERLRAFNRGFKQPMTERELEHTICTAVRKGGYKYSNARLIEFLEITPDEQDAIGLHPFTGAYKPWSHSKPNAARDSVRKALKDDRNAKILAMHSEGISQAQTARELSISRNTVAKVIKDAAIEKDLEIARDNLLNNGSIYDCLLVLEETAVSTEERHLPSPAVIKLDDYRTRPPDGS